VDTLPDGLFIRPIASGEFLIDDDHIRARNDSLTVIQLAEIFARDERSIVLVGEVTPP
jgi:hypothetical protein